VHHFGLRPSASARQQTVKPRGERLAMIRIFEELLPGQEGSCDAVRRYSKVLLIDGEGALTPAAQQSADFDSGAALRA
jgi:hypothetical protein